VVHSFTDIASPGSHQSPAAIFNPHDDVDFHCSVLHHHSTLKEKKKKKRDDYMARTKTKGKGWFGEIRRHSAAAKQGWKGRGRTGIRHAHPGSISQAGVERNRSQRSKFSQQPDYKFNTKDTFSKFDPQGRVRYSLPEDHSMILKDSAKQKTEDSRIVELKKIGKNPDVKINEPVDAFLLIQNMEDYDREHARLIHLDSNNRVVGVENISTGSLNASIVHPRETVKGALLNDTKSVIFVHNHPSGNPKPSDADLQVHADLKDAFKTIGVNLQDSMVIGRDSYVSFKESGL
jgi:proteasome lid subunit RPN8/RPN11